MARTLNIFISSQSPFFSYLEKSIQTNSEHNNNLEPNICVATCDTLTFHHNLQENHPTFHLIKNRTSISFNRYFSTDTLCISAFSIESSNFPISYREFLLVMIVIFGIFNREC